MAQHHEGVHLVCVAGANLQLRAARVDVACFAAGCDVEVGVVVVVVVVESSIAHVAVLVKDDVSGMGASLLVRMPHVVDDRLLVLVGGAALVGLVRILDLLVCEGTSWRVGTHRQGE